MPGSKLKEHIAEILQREGYIQGFDVKDEKVGKTLTLSLKYGPNRETSIVASSAYPSRVCVSTQSRPNSPPFTVASVSRFCPPPPVC